MKPRKITIARQMHTTNVKKDRDAVINAASDIDFPSANSLNRFNAVAESQFKLLKHIQNNNNTLVILENNFSLKRGHLPDLDAKAKSLFPKGLPASFNELTFLQKKFLYLNPGSAVHLGLISQTHDDEMAHYQDFEVLRYNGDLDEKTKQAFLSREYIALRNARNLAITKDSSVMLVYGGAHFFNNVKLVKCFSDIALDRKDFTVPLYDHDTNLDLFTALKQIEQEMAVYPKLDCVVAARQFDFSDLGIPQITNNKEVKPASSDGLSITRVAVIGGVLALGAVALFGLFGCCRRKCRSKKPTPTTTPKLKGHRH